MFLVWFSHCPWNFQHIHRKPHIYRFQLPPHLLLIVQASHPNSKTDHTYVFSTLTLRTRFIPRLTNRLSTLSVTRITCLFDVNFRTMFSASSIPATPATNDLYLNIQCNSAQTGHTEARSTSMAVAAWVHGLGSEAACIAKLPNEISVETSVNYLTCCLSVHLYSEAISDALILILNQTTISR